jgi:hypothetical protein
LPDQLENVLPQAYGVIAVAMLAADNGIIRMVALSSDKDVDAAPSSKVAASLVKKASFEIILSNDC